MSFFPPTLPGNEKLQGENDENTFVTPLKARRVAFIESKMQRVTKAESRDTSLSVVIRETEKGEFSLHNADRDIRQCIESKKQEIPKSRRRIEQLEWIRDNTTNTIERKDAIDEIFRIEKKIDRYESGEIAREYERSVRPIFIEYEKLLQTPVSSGFFTSSNVNTNTIKQKKRKLLSKFIQTVSKFVKVIPPKSMTYTSSGVRCANPECSSSSFDQDGDILYCRECNTCIEVFEDAPTYSDKSRLNMTKRFRYSCERHFRDAYDRFQGKQNNIVVQDVFDRIDDFIQQNVTINRNEMTHRQIRIVLELYPQFAKYYEDVWLIHSIVTGIQPADISDYHDCLFEDYKKQQNIADEIKKSKTRKNSLNVYYILCRLLQKNGYKCKLREFYCLKTEDTLEDHNRVWALRCKRLGWPITID